MLYSGSKKKIAKHILPIILSGRKEDQWYVEPFCGGANLIDKVPGKRIASDSNYQLISFFKAVQRGWIPPTFLSREEYYAIKKNPSMYDPPLICFAAVPCSFGAKWWGGYAANKAGKNYAAAGVRGIIKQAPDLSSIFFVNRGYLDLYLPDNSIVYCDPPYKNTAGYGVGFDHDVFWEWCRKVSKEGHTVYVSEVNAPDDFRVVWESIVKVRMNKNNASDERIERLFTV